MNHRRAEPRPFIAAASVTFASLAFVGPADAQLVEIEWNKAGDFERSLTVAPAKFAEVCGKLAKGQVVVWSFKAQQPLNFNIHYHEGKSVVFAAKQDSASSLDGSLTAPLQQDYCWMWENKGVAPALIRLTMRRA